MIEMCLKKKKKKGIVSLEFVRIRWRMVNRFQEKFSYVLLIVALYSFDDENVLRKC